MIFPPLPPNLIDAMWTQFRNDGMYYLDQLGGPPLHVDEWRRREIDRWEQSNGSPRVITKKPMDAVVAAVKSVEPMLAPLKRALSKRPRLRIKALD